MKKLSFLCLSICLQFQVSAQLSWKGILTDKSGSPLENILIQDRDGICKTTSEKDGSFEFICGASIKTVQFMKNGELLKTIDLPITDAIKNSPLILAIDKSIQDAVQIAVINIPGGDGGDNDQEEISSILSASGDVFNRMAGVSWSAAGFDVRGYEQELQTVYINGIPVNDPESGNSFFGAWGGLNDVMRTDQNLTGLNPIEFGFGNLGGTTIINSSAATQRAQTRVGYLSTNRTFRNRIMLTHSTGVLSNGWAFSFSGSRRWAQEGYVDGTTFDAWSYFASAEKKFKNGDGLSFTLFGAPLRRGRANPGIQEVNDLSGSNFYNPNWGFQNGEKRNARVLDSHLPVGIINYLKNFSSKLKWNTAISVQAGREGNTNLDWFDAPDPRPDYYKRLPSAIDNPDTKAEVTEFLKSNESARQINWDAMFRANAFANDTVFNANGVQGNTVVGKNARYLVVDRRTDQTSFVGNTYLNYNLNDRVNFELGFTGKYFKGKNFQIAQDLLGADYLRDLDRFAILDFPDDSVALQNDIDVPNKIVRQGEKYGYNYDNHIRQYSPWFQTRISLKKWDLFLAYQYTKTQMWRDGLVRNGRFQNNSFGKSQVLDFDLNQIKGGVTYKLSNVHYVYAHGAYVQQAPLLRDVFLSPRTRDQIVQNPTSEKITNGEVGYIVKSPILKLRISGYYTQFRDLARTYTFFNDDERTFINYTLSGIGRTHYGTEIGFEYKLNPTFTIQGAANIGNYYFDKRPLADITKDNTSSLVADNRLVYMKNFNVANTPQEAYGLSLRFNAFYRIYGSLSVNYYRRMYIDVNPDRRTGFAVDGLSDASSQYQGIIDQEEVEDAYTVDLFIGRSWNVKKCYVQANISVNNLLNDQSIRTGGFEQLRYDYEQKDINKFPPRYFYMFGTTFNANLSVSF